MIRDLLFGSEALRSERRCGFVEFTLRRVVSSIGYYKFYRTFNPRNPFWTPRSIKYILSRPALKTWDVFEWGSGASTLWLGKHVSSVVSIEHNEIWFDKGMQEVNRNHVENIDLRFIPAPNGDFTEYAYVINDYANESFDLIVIDGRWRMKCFEQAVSKVKRGGYILFDDSHRTRYKEAWSSHNEFFTHVFDFGLMQTTLMHKNEHVEKSSKLP